MRTKIKNTNLLRIVNKFTLRMLVRWNAVDRSGADHIANLTIQLSESYKGNSIGVKNIPEWTRLVRSHALILAKTKSLSSASAEKNLESKPLDFGLRI